LRLSVSYGSPVLSFQIELAQTAVQQLAMSLCLNGADGAHSTNPKFGKLMLSAINIYGGHVSLYGLDGNVDLY
jgi:hypothetical protein